MRSSVAALQSTPSCLKVGSVVCAGGHVVMCRRPCGGVGGPWDFSVSPSPFGLDFGTLDFGTLDLGLTILLGLLISHIFGRMYKRGSF